MSSRECYVKFAATFAAIVIGTCSAAVAQPSSQASSAGSDESTQTKIARALSAAPPDVAREAKVAEVDSQGRIVKILREGPNGFTCMPGDPKQVGRPAMCADKASMQWSNDFLQHSQNRPTLPRASFTCWLALHSEVTRIRMTRQVRPLRLVPIG